MKKRSTLYFLVVICFFNACSTGNSPNTPPGIPDERNQLSPFVVNVVNRAATSANIEWTESVDYVHGDSVKYLIMLDDVLIDSGLYNRQYDLLDLLEDRSYNGTVIAYTYRGDTASAPFILERIDGYLFLGDRSNNSFYAFNIYNDTRVWNSLWFGSNYFSGIPTIVNDTVYTNNSEVGTMAFEVKTGKKIWGGNPGLPAGANLYPTCPVYNNGTIYSVMPNSGVYAINAKTGKTIWNYKNGEQFFTNPVITGNKIFAGTYKNFSALDINTGSLIWQFDFEVNEQMNIGPLAYSDLVIIATSKSKLMAFNRETGSIAWSKIFGNDRQIEFASPQMYEGLLIMPTPDGYTAFDPLTGNIIWKNGNYRLPVASSPTAGDDKIFFVGGSKIFALDSNNGQLIWETEGGSIYSNNIIFADRKVYIPGWSGYVVLNAADGTPLMHIATEISNIGGASLNIRDTSYYPAQSGMIQ